MTIKQVIENNESGDSQHIISTVNGYDFELYRDESADGDWYIQVSPTGECFLYDGWWNDSSDKTVEEAIAEACAGAGIM